MQSYQQQRQPHTLRRSPFYAIAIVALVFILMIASCDRKPSRPPLPEGPQTVTGILRPAPLSAIRRGTHTLEVGGQQLSFVESSAVSLAVYEGLQVTIKGTFVENTEPDILPVLIADEVVGRAMSFRQWKVPVLNLTLSAPEDWMGVQTDTGMNFGFSGATRPVLAIGKPAYKELPAGTPLTVGGQKAVRILEGTGSQIVYIQSGKDIITFVFSPAASTADARLEQMQAFQRILQTASFGRAPGSTTGGGTTSTGTGTAAGQPCGGEAGILCPTGQYCAITDFQLNIGRCKLLR